MKCVYSSCFSLHPPVSCYRSAFPAGFPISWLAQADWVSQLPLLIRMWSWWRPRWRVEWGLSTLGHFKLEKKKLCKATDALSWAQVDCPLSFCRHCETYLMVEAQIGLFAWFPGRKMSRSRIALWLASCSSMHNLFFLTNGFVGHAKGNGQEFIFPSSLRKLIRTFRSQPFL